MYNWRQIKVIKPLTGLSNGDTGEIVQVRGKPWAHYRLHSLGLTLGCSVSMVKCATAQDSSMTIRIGDKLVSLEKNLALNIKVRVPLAIAENNIPNISKEFARVTVLHG